MDRLMAMSPVAANDLYHAAKGLLEAQGLMAHTAPECVKMREAIDKATADDHLAGNLIGVIELAREVYCSDDVEIDDYPATSEGEDGCWVAAWVWIADPITEDMPL